MQKKGEQKQEEKEKKNWWKSAKETMRIAPAAFLFVFRASPGYFTAALLLQVLNGIAPAIEIYLGKRIFDAAQASMAAHALLPDVFWNILALVGVVFISRLFTTLSGVVEIGLRAETGNHVSARIAEHTMRLDLTQIEDAEFQKIRELIMGESWRIAQFAFSVQAFIGDFVASISILGVLWSFSPLYVSLFTLIMLAGIALGSYINELRWNVLNWKTPKVRYAAMLFRIMMDQWHAREIRILNLSKTLLGRYSETMDEVLRNDVKSGARLSLLLVIPDALSVGLYGFVYFMIVRGVVLGAYTLGDLALYASGFLRLEGSLRGIGWSFRELQACMQYYGKIHGLMMMQPAVRPDGARRLRSGEPMEIRFEDVGFKYQTANDFSIRHISFTIKPGEIVGLVGENGAGKTTLLKLLTHLYEPTEGRIFINGIDYREYRLLDLRKNLSVVFQDYSKFQFPARDNIQLGDVDRKKSETEMMEAARLSGAHPVVMKLQDKYETILSTGWPGGVDISGGEWQKIALARALYRRNAKLMVLDEPTSAFDAKAEFEFFREFIKEMERKKRSAIIVSHRFSNIRLAEHIVVMAKGRVVEQGSHEELMEKNGRYAELYLIQKDALA